MKYIITVFNLFVFSLVFAQPIEIKISIGENTNYIFGEGIVLYYSVKNISEKPIKIVPLNFNKNENRLELINLDKDKIKFTRLITLDGYPGFIQLNPGEKWVFSEDVSSNYGNKYNEIFGAYFLESGKYRLQACLKVNGTEIKSQHIFFTIAGFGKSEEIKLLNSSKEYILQPSNPVVVNRLLSLYRSARNINSNIYNSIGNILVRKLIYLEGNENIKLKEDVINELITDQIKAKGTTMQIYLLYGDALRGKLISKEKLNKLVEKNKDLISRNLVDDLKLRQFAQ